MNLTNLIQNTLSDTKATDILQVEVCPSWLGVDQVIICSAMSSRHLCALQEHIAYALKSAGADTKFALNTTRDIDWVCLTTSDHENQVLIHIMLDTTRTRYGIDELVMNNSVHSSYDHSSWVQEEYL